MSYNSVYCNLGYTYVFCFNTTITCSGFSLQDWAPHYKLCAVGQGKRSGSPKIKEPVMILMNE